MNSQSLRAGLLAAATYNEVTNSLLYTNPTSQPISARLTFSNALNGASPVGYAIVKKEVDHTVVGNLTNYWQVYYETLDGRNDPAPRACDLSYNILLGAGEKLIIRAEDTASVQLTGVPNRAIL